MAKRVLDGALLGIAVAAVALGVAELASVLTGSQTAPLVAVDGLVIANLAGEKDLAVRLFGTNDKLALLIGTLVVLLVFAVVIGMLARRNIRYGYAGLAVFGLIGVTAAVTRYHASVAAALPSILGAAAAAGALRLLLPHLQASTEPAAVAAAPAAVEEAPDEPYPYRARPARSTGRPVDPAVERRSFLRGVGISVVGAALVGWIGRNLAELRGVSAARDAVQLPTPSTSAGPLPSAVDLKIPGLSSYVTDNGKFYRIDTADLFSPPQVDPATWTLKIHGRVKKPITLTFDQLLQRPTIERYVTLCCVSNVVGGDLIGNALWLGVPLKDLLEEAHPDAGADQVVSRSVDGFTAGSPTSALMDGRDAMIAIGMNGEPLPVKHGFPARLVVPGLYGYVSATKWLAELELTSFADFNAFWIRQENGSWAQQGPIKTESRIDVPRQDRGPVMAGQVTVAGVAWAQHRGISKVEVQVDDGGWQEATLAATVSTDTWRQWSWRWSASPGTHTLRVRATDNAGAVQAEAVADPQPSGATGYHTIEITVQ